MSKSIRKANRLALLPLSVSVAALMSSLAIADDSSVGFTLEEVVVTATKRAQSAQDIPMSIEAVSGEKLDQMGIDNFEDLSATIPNFSVGDSLTTSNITMRGMGSGSDRGFEQSVSMFQDGIYMPRSRQTRSPFFDAERVEVLRGPQAVLFGLNSTAGAVSVHSAKNQPGDAFEAKVAGDYDLGYGGSKLSAIVGGSPVESLGVRLAVQQGDSNEGYVKNDTLDDDAGQTRQESARLTMVWEPLEELSVTAKYEYADFEMFGNMGEVVNGIAGLFEPNDGKLDWEQSSDGSIMSLMNSTPGNVTNHDAGGVEQRVQNAMVNVEYDINEYTVNAVMGYSDYSYDMVTDLDTLAIPMWDAANYEEYDQASMELRLTSPTGGKFEYITGVYYQTANLLTDQPNVLDLGILFNTFFGSGTPAGVLYERNTQKLDQQTDLLSFFFSGTWNVSEVLRVTAGVRTTDEDKDYDRFGICQTTVDGGASWTTVPSGTVVCSAAPDTSGKLKSTNVMPELLAQYDISEDHMIYLKYGESAKSGGIGTAGSIAASQLLYDDESVRAFELGLKSQLANGAAELNVTLFRNEFTDLQVKSSAVDQGTGAIITVISNAGESISEGIEIDGRWALAEWLTVGGSLAWLNAEYESYPAGPCNTSGSTTASATVAGACDLKGESLPFAADVTGSFFADIDYALSDQLNLVAGITVSYSDAFATNGTLEPNLMQDDWTKVAARIGVSSKDEQWSVTLVGNNLTDEKVITGVQPFLGYDIGYLGTPRTVSLQGIYRFGM